jgi:two-component system chemotaxis response regulator CheB
MRKFDAIVIGGSAGSFQIIVSILSSLPKTFQIPIILCFHRLRNERHGFVEALLPHSVLPIIEPLDKTVIENGNIYLAPANYHLYIEDNKTISLSVEEPENHSRPSIDLAFFSASKVYGNALLGIILSGANNDGAMGAKFLKDHGGFLVVQDPQEAEVKIMTLSAINNGNVDKILKTSEIVSLLGALP